MVDLMAMTDYRVDNPFCAIAPIPVVFGQKQVETIMNKVKFFITIVLGFWTFASMAQRQESTWAFKFTPSVYAGPQQTTATDLNLRGNTGQHTLWLGQYTRPGEFQQARTGYEFNAKFPGFQLTPSVQVASRGFWGGSLNATVGETVFGILGLGRTNLKDYYNLNFDPNDALTFGVGGQLPNNHQLSLFKIKDNRLHTDQEVTHLVWRHRPDAHHRWTVDLSYKQGRPRQGLAMVQGHALSLGYDHHDVFFKIAKDQKVNFSDVDQWRVAAGWRF
jgi:hypothetical protein